MLSRFAVTSLVIATAACFAISPSAAAQDSTAAKAVPPVDIHGYLLVWYRVGDPTTPDGFRLRKADFKFSGVLSPRLKWRLSLDLGKALTLVKTTSTPADSLALRDVSVDQKSKVLQDAALTYSVNPYLYFDVGQQVLPLGLEGTSSASVLETSERALFETERSRGVGLGDVRDIGVSMNGRVDFLEYHFGTYNETGDDQGSTDTNDQKAFVGRLELHPSVVPGLQFGGSGAYQGGSFAQHRQRGAGDVQYKDAAITLRAEAMSARDGALNRFGWYALSAYRPTTRLQFVGRFDDWDRDRRHESSIADAFERQITGGVSYLIDNASGKIGLNVVRQTFPNVPSLRSGTIFVAAFSGVW